MVSHLQEKLSVVVISEPETATVLILRSGICYGGRPDRIGVYIALLIGMAMGDLFAH